MILCVYQLGWSECRACSFSAYRDHEIMKGKGSGSGIGSGKLGSQDVSVTRKTACFKLCKVTLLNYRWSWPGSLHDYVDQISLRH